MKVKTFLSETNYEKCPPRPDALILSLRAFGYDMAMAIADLIDNSISANSSNVWISYEWNDGNPWVRIMDDGTGMSERELVEAMRLGSKNPLQERKPDDLGRFGLGLKTASFSQCKLMTVASKKSGGKIAVRYWDLDYVQETSDWNLGITPNEKTTRLLAPLSEKKEGTLIVWEKLDRIINSETNLEEAFQRQFLEIKKYLEMVFHKYLEDENRKLDIHVGLGRCVGYDPFLKNNKYSYELASESFEGDRVTIHPHVLPHISKRTEVETINGAGIRGWNAQQGFYVYRNRRMIVSGGYLDLDLKAEEHYKLARIEIDLNNEQDHEWSIDVRKAVAYAPQKYRRELTRIAKATRQTASEAYRRRAMGPKGRRSRGLKNDIWLRKKNGDKVLYVINRDSPVIKKILSEYDLDNKWIEKLFYSIEKSVPHKTIIMDEQELEGSIADVSSDINPPPPELVNLCIEFYKQFISDGKSHEEAARITISMEPFNAHPAYRARLDGLREENENDHR
jgi:hypothetical protein